MPNGSSESEPVQLITFNTVDKELAEQIREFLPPNYQVKLVGSVTEFCDNLGNILSVVIISRKEFYPSERRKDLEDLIKTLINHKNGKVITIVDNHLVSDYKKMVQKDKPIACIKMQWDRPHGMDSKTAKETANKIKTALEPVQLVTFNTVDKELAEQIGETLPPTYQVKLVGSVKEFCDSLGNILSVVIISCKEFYPSERRKDLEDLIKTLINHKNGKVITIVENHLVSDYEKMVQKDKPPTCIKMEWDREHGMDTNTAKTTAKKIKTECVRLTDTRTSTHSMCCIA